MHVLRVASSMCWVVVLGVLPGKNENTSTGEEQSRLSIRSQRANIANFRVIAVDKLFSPPHRRVSSQLSETVANNKKDSSAGEIKIVRLPHK